MATKTKLVVIVSGSEVICLLANSGWDRESLEKLFKKYMQEIIEEKNIDITEYGGEITADIIIEKYRKEFVEKILQSKHYIREVRSPEIFDYNGGLEKIEIL